MTSNASPTTDREQNARRPSFRKSIAEAGLTPQYLESLEQKRKQLDDSIHKYIAAKEREYKAFEKDLRAKSRTDEPTDTANGNTRRRTAAEDGRHSTAKAPSSAVDALFQNDARRYSHSRSAEDESSPPPALLQDRRANTEREKDFVGVFVPPFIPALDTKDGAVASSVERAASALSMVEQAQNKESPIADDGIHRAKSDTIVLASQAAISKRPVHLQLSRRTSSSGSSVDGKLISAMKSPTEPAKIQRKRVSLAVGDTIVAPSDHVPLSMSNNNLTPSHSRTRVPVSDRSRLSTIDTATPTSGLVQVTTSPVSGSIGVDGSDIGGLSALYERSLVEPATTPTTIPRSVPAQPGGDDIGEIEFRHLEEEADAFPDAESVTGARFSDDSDEELSTSMAGRIDSHASHEPSTDIGAQEYAQTERVEDLPDSAQTTSHLEVMPATPTSAQQPRSPGFRRPSVQLDPAYNGRDYMRAAMNADDTGVYGSSARPGKGGFTSGSLGESYMARHAEEMGRLRGARREAQARS
jgi:hypothetical protein